MYDRASNDPGQIFPSVPKSNWFWFKPLDFDIQAAVSLYLAINEDKVLEQMIAEALDSARGLRRGEWLLSRRDGTIVARHEVPGIMRKIAPSQRDD